MLFIASVYCAVHASNWHLNSAVEITVYCTSSVCNWCAAIVPVWYSGNGVRCVNERSCISSPVSTGMGDYLRAGKPPRCETTSLCNQPPMPTQPPTLNGTGNEHRPKCDGALRLGSKGSYRSFHLWIKLVGGRQNCMISHQRVPYLSALEMSSSWQSATQVHGFTRGWLYCSYVDTSS